jgi:hypothetical protein
MKGMSTRISANLPRHFCIDGRAADDFSVGSLLAQETIEEIFESGNDAFRKVVEQTPLVLSHPDQVFLADTTRVNTRHRSGRSPLAWLWEKEFVRKSRVEAFHRFRPVDRLTPHHHCTSITTLLPATRKLPFFLSRRNGHQYAVPSHQDQLLLESVYHIPADQITVVRPGPRGYIHTAAAPKATNGGLLFLLGNLRELPDLKKRVALASQIFPQMPKKVVRLNSRKPFLPATWLRILRNTGLVFYLTSSPFDWATLALETIFWEIPTIFLETHGVFSDLLPSSPLGMSRFLIEQPDLAALQKEVKRVKALLTEKRIYERGAHASQYLSIYARLGKSLSRPAN